MKHFSGRLTLALIGMGLVISARADIAKQAERARVGGVDTITYNLSVPDVVTMAGTLPVGDSASGEKPAVAKLTADMLSRGTLTHDKLAIAKVLDEVGAQINFYTNTTSLRITARCLKKDVPTVIRLIAQELREPRFSPEEYGKSQAKLRSEVQGFQQRTSDRADESLARAIFPEGHPNRLHTAQEWLKSIDDTTLEDLKAFHRSNYGPHQLTLVFAGDVDPVEIKRAVKQSFVGWAGGREAPRNVGAASEPTDLSINVAMADKASVSVAFGQRTGLRYTDPDTLALRVGTSILGSGSGRLMKRVREEEGLTYGIYADLEGDTYSDGSWQISADFAPALLGQGVSSTKKLIEEWWQTGVTTAELEKQKKGLIGAYKVGLATSAGLAYAILQTTERGLPLTWMDQYPLAINSLTVEQVNTAIRRHLNPKTIVLVEAGASPRG